MPLYTVIRCDRCEGWTGGTPLSLWDRPGGTAAAQEYAERSPCPGCRSLSRQAEERDLLAEEARGIYPRCVESKGQ